MWLVTGDVHGGQLMRGDGTSWTVVNGVGSPPGFSQAPSEPVQALWVIARDDVFVSSFVNGGSFGGIYRWDGSQWATYNTNDNRVVNHFWGGSASDVWGAQDDGQYLGHWDGTTWTHIDSQHGGVLAGGAPGDFWRALGSVLQHHSPSGAYDVYVDLSRNPGSSSLVHAGWASATDDVWFVGDAALHFDGATWTTVTLPSAATLRSVWGSSRADVWAVGDGGTVEHFDGTAWSAVASPTTGNLASVWSSGPCDVWAIGNAVYHASPQ